MSENRAWLPQLRSTTLLYPLLSVVALVVVFTIASPNFLTLDNFSNIGRQASVLLLVSLAGTVVILIGSIDLSVGANVTLSGLVTALTLDKLGVAGGLLAGIAVGAVIGLFNGSVYTVFRVPSFLVTLGSLSICGGIADHLSKGSAVLFSETGLTGLVNAGPVLGIPNIVLIVLVVTGVLTFTAFRTSFGRYLFAIGGGEPVAALSGLNVRGYKIAAFVLAGALCGLGGVLITGQVQAGSPGAGDAMLLDSIAAVVMGGTALSGGLGGPHRTLLGVVVIAILSNGMDLMGIDSFTQEIVKGIVVILAVALTIDRSRYAAIK
ncbi:ABC transporter permease [Amycolatopsis sp. CA-161197]|uniref:ABC transporter permease n=1 Tax=Amycolatopsis sp. CA-161197 TaxID=3239922 RepID=UPI003D90DB37